jgi:hypothetical protein
LGNYAAEAVARVIEALAVSAEPREDLKRNIEKLQE